MPSEVNKRLGLIEKAPIMVHSIDADGVIQSTSEYWLQTTGYTREEVIGRNSLDFLTPDSRQYALEEVLPSLWEKGETSNRLLKVWTKSGSVIEVQVSAIVEYDEQGKPQGAVAVSVDVTAQRQAQEALINDQERLNLAVKAGEIGIWDWYIDENKLVWNDQMYRLFGVDADNFTTDYVGIINCVHKDEREYVNQVVQDAVAKTHKLKLEYRIVRPDGSIRHLSVRGKVYLNKNGQPERMTGNCIDVTERVLAEQALRASEERFQLAVDSAEEGIWDRADVNRDSEYWSPHFKELLGYRDDEIVASRSTFRKLLHPDDIERTSQAIAEHITDGTPYEIDYRLKTRSGEYRWFHARGSTLRDERGRPRRMCGTITDIEHRVRDEQALSRLYAIASDDKLRLANKISSILRLALDYLELSTGVVSRIHGNHYDIQHVTTNEMGINPGDRFKLDDMFCSQTVTSDDVLCLNAIGNTEFNNHPCHHNLRLESYVGSRLTVGDRVYGTVNFFSRTARAEPFRGREKVFVQLVSQWIGYELSREEFIQNLIHAESRLEKTIEDLVASNTELNRFAYVASHDLQEPLRMIVSFTQLLQKKYGDRLDDTARKYMRISSESAQRMQHMIGDLLQYSRIESENVEQKAIASRTALEYALENLSQIIADKNANIEYSDLPTVRANPIRLSRLFQNLISNALKYQQSGVTPVVNISARRKKDEWIFSISDNGIGMKPEHLHQVFEPFNRLHHHDEYEGTGIGLAICKKIVQTMNGHIWVESEYGQGSIFHFSLPSLDKVTREQVVNQGAVRNG